MFYHPQVAITVHELFDDGLFGLAEEPAPYAYTLIAAAASAAA